jgi:hypothetical protein
MKNGGRKAAVSFGEDVDMTRSVFVVLTAVGLLLAGALSATAGSAHRSGAAKQASTRTLTQAIDGAASAERAEAAAAAQSEVAQAAQPQAQTQSQVETQAQDEMQDEDADEDTDAGDD